jgi:hypothetical protein
VYIISNQSKKGKNGENEITRLSFAKECFFKFYGYQNLSEEEKEIKLNEHKGFDLAAEIKDVTSSFKQMLMFSPIMINRTAIQSNIHMSVQLKLSSP